MEEESRVYRVRDDSMRELQTPRGERSRLEAYRLVDCLDIRFQSRENWSMVLCLLPLLLFFGGAVFGTFFGVVASLDGDPFPLWMFLFFYDLPISLIITCIMHFVNMHRGKGFHVIIGLNIFVIENLKDGTPVETFSGPASSVFPVRVVETSQTDTEGNIHIVKHCEISGHKFGDRLQDSEREWIISIINQFLAENSVYTPAL